MILRRCHPTVIAGLPTPADDHTTRGNAAFEAKQDVEAWLAYKAAYELEPTAIRAARVAVAAAYAREMSVALDDLGHWLEIKRRDARNRGDQEDSWNALEEILEAYEANARRTEQEIDLLKEAVRRLEAEARPKRSTKPDKPRPR